MLSNILKTLGNFVGYLNPQGKVPSASINYLGIRLDFLTPGSEPLSNSNFNPSTYLTAGNI